MPPEQQQPGKKEEVVVIFKRGGGEDDGHGSTTWKIAYADFVTAMMAFFLLMWLLSSTSEEQKEGITSYFSSQWEAMPGHGSDGILGGTVLEDEGQLSDVAASVSITLGSPKSEKAGYYEKQTELKGDEDYPDLSSMFNPDISGPGGEPLTKKKVKEIEDKAFKKAEMKIKKSLEQDKVFEKLSKHVIVDKTSQGLRIQIIDQYQKSMFEIGKTKLMPDALKILDKVVKVIKSVPNKILITGYTDAKPYKNKKDYNNWDLSTDRANSSRRALIKMGVNEKRFYAVQGKADTDPLIKKDVFSPKNRRISILLLKNEVASYREGLGIRK